MVETEYIKTPASEAEWLKVRTRGIGGSDIASILGLSPWKTPLSVFWDKRPDLAPEGYAERKAQAAEGNLALALGHELEEFTAREYVKRTGRNVRRYGFMVKRGHLIGDVDRLAFCEDGGAPSYHEEVRTNLGIECKTSNQYPWDELPDYYRAQVHHYMGLFDTIEAFDIPCLFKSSSDFRIYRELRDEETIAQLREVAEAFWGRFVLPGVTPPAQTEEDCKLLWARSTSRSLTASPELRDAVGHYAELEAQAKGLKEEMEAVKGTIVCMMEDADTLVDEWGDKLASYKSNKDSTKTDWEALAKRVMQDELTDDETSQYIANFTATKPGARVFRLAKAKAKK